MAEPRGLMLRFLEKQKADAAARLREREGEVLVWAVKLWQHGHEEEIRIDFDKAVEDAVNAERVYRRMSKELERFQTARRKISSKRTQDMNGEG